MYLKDFWLWMLSHQQEKSEDAFNVLPFFIQTAVYFKRELWTHKSLNCRKKIDALSQANAEIIEDKQKYLSAKQSFQRMSSRLRKLCKRLAPTTEIVLEMQKIAAEIRDYSHKIK